MKFCHLPHCVQQFMFYVLSNGKSLLFLILFGMLAIKGMAFHEILPFTPLCVAIYVLCIVKWEISTISHSV